MEPFLLDADLFERALGLFFDVAVRVFIEQALQGGLGFLVLTEAAVRLCEVEEKVVVAGGVDGLGQVVEDLLEFTDGAFGGFDTHRSGFVSVVVIEHVFKSFSSQPSVGSPCE